MFFILIEESFVLNFNVALVKLAAEKRPHPIPSRDGGF